MANRSYLLSAILFLVLLLAGGVIGPTNVVEARLCESQSHKFRGTCLSGGNCANVCRLEGFHGGKCRGFHRRCFCTRLC